MPDDELTDAAKQRARRARRTREQEAFAALPAGRSHGEWTSYTEHGCRCEACTAANTARNAEWRERNRERVNEQQRARRAAAKAARKSDG